MTYFAPNMVSKHCFFGSEGGVSTGVYASLNTNNKSLDDPAKVSENLDIIAKKMGCTKEALTLQKQGFTDLVNYVRAPSFYELIGDGLVTDKPGVVLCIRVADCAPVLFEDRKNGIIGGAHAGWRSALKGVLERTLDVMQQKGAELKNIHAAIGPCLQKESFSAGRDMYDLFVGADEQYAKYFEPQGEKYVFDFEAFVYTKLQKYGLENISKSAIDTYKDEEYYSFRRSTHRREIKQPGDFPTQLATIVL